MKFDKSLMYAHIRMKHTGTKSISITIHTQHTHTQTADKWQRYRRQRIKWEYEWKKKMKWKRRQKIDKKLITLVACRFVPLPYARVLPSFAFDSEIRSTFAHHFPSQRKSGIITTYSFMMHDSWFMIHVQMHPGNSNSPFSHLSYIYGRHCDPYSITHVIK